jgi:hypothetical protein
MEWKLNNAVIRIEVANYFEACLLSLSMRSKRHVFSSTAMKSYINCTSNGRKRVLFKNYSIMLQKN